jgi:hypothetical protein
MTAVVEGGTVPLPDLNQTYGTSFEVAMIPLISINEISSFFPASRDPKIINEDYAKESSINNALVGFLALIEEDVIQCTERKVYVDPTDYITDEYRYLSRNYHWITFTMSKDEFLWSQYIFHGHL